MLYGLNVIANTKKKEDLGILKVVTKFSKLNIPSELNISSRVLIFCLLHCSDINGLVPDFIFLLCLSGVCK